VYCTVIEFCLSGLRKHKEDHTYITNEYRTMDIQATLTTHITLQ